MAKRSDLGLRLVPPPGPDRDAFSARFWSRVDRTSPDGCWPWTGCVSDRGYGNFSFATKGPNRQRTGCGAHRIAFFLSRKGKDPGDLDVDHMCRNRLCCRPTHLRLLTHAANVARGEAHGAARLNADLVREIRAAFSGGETGSAIALRIGVATSTVTAVLRGSTWRHVV